MPNGMVLSATLQLKDKMTASIDKAKKSVTGMKSELQSTGGVANAVSGNFNKTGSAVDNLSRKTTNLKRNLNGLKGNYTANVSLKDNATAACSKIKNQINQITSKQHVIKITTQARNIGGAAVKGLGKIGNAAGGIASGMLMNTGVQMAGAAGIGFGMYNAVKSYMDFEKEMSTVQALSGATGSAFDALTKKAKEMGRTTKFTATESAKAFSYMGMAGWKTEEMLNGIEGVMHLAAASGEDLATVSDIVTDDLTAFGLKAKDATMFADVLAATATNTNTTVGKMGETFKYAAPLAGTFGYSVQDVATAVGLMANGSIKDTQAGTSLRELFTRMVSPVKASAAAMDALGIKMADSSGKMRPLRSVMLDLRNGFKGLTQEQKGQYAASLAGQRGMSGLLNIVNASDEDFNKITKAIDESAGAAKRMAAIKLNNLSGDVTLAASAFDGLTLSIMSGKMSGGLRDFVQEGTKLITNFTKRIEESGLSFENIVKTMGEGVESLARKAVKMDGIGSVLAGGALAYGGYKGFKMGKGAFNAVRGIFGKGAAATPSGGLGGLASDMVVNANTVVVNGSISGAAENAADTAAGSAAGSAATGGAVKGATTLGMGTTVGIGAATVAAGVAIGLQARSLLERGQFASVEQMKKDFADNPNKDLAEQTYLSDSVGMPSVSRGLNDFTNDATVAPIDASAFEGIAASSEESLNGIKSQWADCSSWFDGTVWSPLSTNASGSLSSIASSFSSAVGSCESAWAGVSSWFQANVWGPLSASASGVFASISSGIAGLSARVSSFGGGVEQHATGADYFSGGFTQINENGNGELVDLPGGSRIYPAATTERILSREASRANSSDNGSVMVTGNTFIVRQQEDIDGIANKLFQLIHQAEANYGGA